MKNSRMNFLTKFSVLCLGLLHLCSCQDDFKESVTVGTDASVNMSAEDFFDGDIANNDQNPSTRSSLIPNGNGTSFSWKSGDVAGVYSSGKGLTNFFIDDESISEDGTSATFNGSGFSLNSDALYYAFYPYSASALNKTMIPISYTGQVLRANGSFSDLGSYDYMWARGTTDTEGNVGFAFAHLGCVVEMKLEAPVAATYTQVRLELENNTDSMALIKKGTVDITSVEPVIKAKDVSPSDSILRVSLNGDEGIAVPKDSILHIYMMMAPQDLSSKNIIIRLVDKTDKWYTARMAGKNMKAGHTYHYFVGKNSSTGSFTGEGVGLPDDYEYRMVSTFTHPQASPYEDILVNGNTVYAIGYFGIRKLDYTDEANPILTAENTTIIDQYSRARSIVANDNYLYVNVRQNTWGDNEKWRPQIRLDFESSINEEIESELSNNETLNAFFTYFNVNRDISRINSATIYKAYKRTDGYRNAIVLRVSGEDDIVFLAKTFADRESALAALTDQYSTNDGDVCKVNWDEVPEGANDFKNLQFYYVKGVYISKAQNTSFDCLGNPSPNQGFYSGRFFTHNITKTSQVTVRNTIQQINEGWFSFWINVPKTFSQTIKCPLTYINKICLSRINLIPTNNGYSICLKNTESNNQIFNIGNWYNIKVHISPKGSDLYYRNADCTTWTFLEHSSEPAQTFNAVSIGISTDQSNAEVHFDDFYFNETDIDEVSYVNGKVFILDKSTLNILNKINLDYRVTGLAIDNNIMVVSGLCNIKFYDISNPTRPRHLYTYQPSFDRDMQGVTTYRYAGRTYAFICCYCTGFMIWDITDKNNIKMLCDEDFSDILINGNPIKMKLNCFSSVINYPYAYLTISPTPSYVSSYKNMAGILTLDISNLSNILKDLSFIPSIDLTDNTSGDPSPTRIGCYGNTLFLNNRDKGVAVFDLLGNKPTYRETYKVGNSINPITITPDGRMFVGDDANVGNLRNLYLIRIE